MEIYNNEEELTPEEVKNEILDDEDTIGFLKKFAQKMGMDWPPKNFKKLRVNSDEHQMLPDEDKVVEDYLNLGYYVIKKLKIKNVSYLTFNDQEEDSLIRIIAVDKDEKEYPLDWDGVVPKSNGDLTEMIYEVKEIFDWNLRYYYKAQMEIRSKAHFARKS